LRVIVVSGLILISLAELLDIDEPRRDLRRRLE